MFNLFLVYVMGLGLIVSVIGLTMIEMMERFSKKYKIVKRSEKIEMKKEGVSNVKNSKVKIAHNDGNIDIRISRKVA